MGTHLSIHKDVNRDVWIHPFKTENWMSSNFNSSVNCWYSDIHSGW